MILKQIALSALAASISAFLLALIFGFSTFSNLAVQLIGVLGVSGAVFIISAPLVAILGPLVDYLSRYFNNSVRIVIALAFSNLVAAWFFTNGFSFFPTQNLLVIPALAVPTALVFFYYSPYRKSSENSVIKVNSIDGK